MTTFHELLIDLHACRPAIYWAGDKTIEQVIAECRRGDWMLWLAKRVNIGLQPLTLAKGHCAATVLHLMKDERSRKAVQAAIDFGEGKITKAELAAAYVAAAAASVAAYADAAAAGTKNKLATADICRKYIGQLIIDKVNELLK